MVGLSLETWVSVAGLLTVLVALSAQARTFRTELKRDIAELRTELKGDIAELRREVKSDITELRTELKGDIERVDDRVYALASGLKPDIERAGQQRRGA